LSQNSDATKASLIRAAEELFAANGVDAVSLRQINRAAGARNAIAVQYHFEDREGVVRAILDKHRPDIEARRHALLDQYEAKGVDDLRELAAALVRPSAAKLTDPDGGRAYLQITSYLINRPDLPTRTASKPDTGNSIRRWHELVGPLVDEQATRLHRRFNAMRFSAVELGRRASSKPRADDSLFVSQLIDMVTALLAAPLSDETLKLAEARSRRKGRSGSHPVT
jgi:AcrR family transcriptional regulator